MKKYLVALLALNLAIVMACNDQHRNIDRTNPQLGQTSQPIINGTKVTNSEYDAAVGLFFRSYGSSDAFCTGTLISDEYVLTAGHCISNCEGDKEKIEDRRPTMRVGIGNSERSFKHIYEIEKFITHPNFKCSDTLIKNDIALVKLKTRVPASVVKPIMPLPPNLALTASEVDGGRLKATHVGFGLTDPDNDYSSGTKYKVDDTIVAVCPLSGKSSNYCSYDLTKGFIYFHYDVDKVGTCSGDSGGPTFMKRNDNLYVIGVTSWGEGGDYSCRGWDAVTSVSDYYDSFIKPNAGDVANPEDCFNEKDDNGDGLIDCKDPLCKIACTPEDCTNKIDDNGDGLIDCEDPQCADELFCQPEICDDEIDNNGDTLIDCKDPQCTNLLRCQPEICNNEKDDNGNGLVDCNDTQCKDSIYCQPEICDDKIDNNGNGLIDCNDPECFVKPICKPEICDDKIDNNGDGLVDCDDPKCAATIYCQSEDCSNKIDDNGNGLIDCDDPDCAAKQICIPEICNDYLDNNGNGLVDCNDPSCSNDIHCKQEICNDKVDNNANGLIDCDDPQCASSPYCAVEICDDGVDNNADGLADCEDPTCASSSSCRTHASNCDAMPYRKNPSFPVFLMALFAFSLFIRRTKNNI